MPKRQIAYPDRMREARHVILRSWHHGCVLVSRSICDPGSRIPWGRFWWYGLHCEDETYCCTAFGEARTAAVLLNPSRQLVLDLCWRAGPGGMLVWEMLEQFLFPRVSSPTSSPTLNLEYRFLESSRLQPHNSATWCGAIATSNSPPPVW